MVAMETFEFCRNYKQILATGNCAMFLVAAVQYNKTQKNLGSSAANQSNAFAIYFPSLLKLFVW
jgi:hypothetical protein